MASVLHFSYAAMGARKKVHVQAQSFLVTQPNTTIEDASFRDAQLQGSNMNKEAVQAMSNSEVDVYGDHEVFAHIGGYAVAGQRISVSFKNGKMLPEVAGFTVDVECICSCEVSTYGVYCLGAGDNNAFTALAYKEGAAWFMEQQSINGDIDGWNYRAVFRFGSNVGGEHSSTGHTFTGPGAASTTQFRASHGPISCPVNVAECVPRCQAYGIATEQLEQKCHL